MKLSLRKSTYTSLLIAFALVIYIVESALPPLIPGVAGARLGLSNIFVLYALYALGWQSAFWVILIKSLFGPILSGTPTGIFFSLVGSGLSLATMIFLKNLLNSKIGIVGVSVVGSLMHNVGQFIVAIIFTSTISISTYFPILASISVPCGIITAVSCSGILKLTESITLKINRIKIGGK